MKNVLIIGGAGFAGANTALHLARTGEYQVSVIDNLVRRGSEYNLDRLADANISFRHGDLRCREDFPWAKEYDAVLVCAAQPSAIDGYSNPTYDFSNNTTGLLHPLEYCKNTGAKLIFFSTNKVYPASSINGRPIREMDTRFEMDSVNEAFPLDGGDRSLYGCSKIMSDLMIQEWSSSFGFPAFVNRFSCLAGPWQWGKTAQGWVAWWVIAHHFGLPLRYYGFKGKQVRDVLFVGDLVRIIQMELESERSDCQVFNVGGGAANACSLIEMTALCQQITGRTVRIDPEGEQRRADFSHYVSDLTKVQREMGWAPIIGLKEGIQQIFSWVLNHESTLAKLYGTGSG